MVLTIANSTSVVQGGYRVPYMAWQPQNVTLTSGAAAVFYASATGSPPPTVQWQSRESLTEPWENVAGETSNTLTVAYADTWAGYQYRAVFTSDVGTVTSATATVTETETARAVSPRDHGAASTILTH